MRLAIDIGGTFTDVLLYDEFKKKVWSTKVSSSPEKPQKAFFEGMEEVIRKTGAEYSRIDTIIHGTTLVTNALLEGKTCKTGLLVTKGFGDLLEIGRQTRPKLYDLQVEKRPPLVPLQLVREVTERVTADGKIIQAFDKEEVRKQLHDLYKKWIESLAVTLLFSFLNPNHEQGIREIALNFFSEKSIFLSSRISPEVREFERASTAVVAAAVAPQVVSYLEAIRNKLNRRNISRNNLFIMHSGGGTLPADEAAQQPHVMIESGPAAGILASEFLSHSLHIDKTLAFDMGGTTAKAGIILDGKAQFTAEYEVGGTIHQGGRTHGGYPVRSSMIDVAECGAGAGSIAWIDAGGHLKVGPQSAGANPGPACYGKGGKEPTVTDAYLILGYLAPDSLLGGKMELYPDLAKTSILNKICQPMGLDILSAASGIITIANTNIMRILRLVTISRGHDPREFSLIAYGGAGPLHATTLAEEMNIKRVIIPRLPGLFSTAGLLSSEPSMAFVKTIMLNLNRTDLKPLNQALLSLKKRADSWFDEIQVPDKQRVLQASADLRYFRQNYELNVPLPSLQLKSEKLGSYSEKFHKIHARSYGHRSDSEAIQVVNLRLKASKKIQKPVIHPVKKASSSADSFSEGRRAIRIPNLNSSKGPPKSLSCKVFDRGSLCAGHVITGPAVIHETEATTLVGPSWEARVDSHGHLLMECI